MPKIKINNIQMYYESHGSGEPLVFVSGFGADHLGWTPILNFFAKEYRVILLCNRGSGQTDSPNGDYSVAQMANDVIALCDALAIEKAHFIGNSMGGMIVQYIAYQYPKRVNSIIVSNSVMKVESVFHIYVLAQLELIKNNAAPDSLVKALCAWIFSYHFLSQEGCLEQLIELQKRNPYPFTTRGYEGQLSALSNFDSREWAKDIVVPVLVVTSDQDIIFLSEKSKQLHVEIKNSDYYCFKNNAHLPHIENPREYFEILNCFLRK